MIHESDAPRIDAVLGGSSSDSGALGGAAHRPQRPALAEAGSARARSTPVSIGALAAGAFSSTAAMAQLLGESEFSVLFHEGVQESMHVSTVDEETILLAIFDERTTVGMVRLFAKRGEPRHRRHPRRDAHPARAAGRAGGPAAAGRGAVHLTRRRSRRVQS